MLTETYITARIRSMQSGSEVCIHVLTKGVCLIARMSSSLTGAPAIHDYRAGICHAWTIESSSSSCSSLASILLAIDVFLRPARLDLGKSDFIVAGESYADRFLKFCDLPVGYTYGAKPSKSRFLPS